MCSARIQTPKVPDELQQDGSWACRARILVARRMNQPSDGPDDQAADDAKRERRQPPG